MFDWPREAQALLRTVNQRVFFCGSNALYREFVECVRDRVLHGAAMDTVSDSSARVCSIGTVDTVFTDGDSSVNFTGNFSAGAEAPGDVFGIHWKKYWSPPYVSMCVYLQSISSSMELQPEEF